MATAESAPPSIPPEAGAAAAAAPQPKQRGCLGCCPTVQPHTMAEAGGSGCVGARVMMLWRATMGVVLLVPIVLSLVLRMTFGDWIVYALNGATLLALAACSHHLASGHERQALSASGVFLHTFAATAASYYAPWYIFEAIRYGRPRIILGMLPYAAFLADTLLMQARLAPPFVYGLPSLLFWFANLLIDILFFKLNIFVALAFALVAVFMLFFTIGLTRIFGIKQPPAPTHNDMPREVGDEMWT